MDGYKVPLPVKKCKKPSFSWHKGRTWDYDWIYINDVKTKAHLDTTWGRRIYFQYGEDGQWYALQMWSEPEDKFKGKGEYSIEPFSTKKTEIFTQPQNGC